MKMMEQEKASNLISIIQSNPFYISYKNNKKTIG